MPCCTTDESGTEGGAPVNIAFIGQGKEILRALLRANWSETSIEATPPKAEAQHFLFNRKPDAVFRMQRDRKHNRNVMYLWLSPYQLEGEPVWLAQVTHFIGRKTQLEDIIFGARIDPDVDDSRSFLLQNLWYSQSLHQIGWINTDHKNVFETESAAAETDKRGYFTDGVRLALWLSGVPVSLTETQFVPWDASPLK